MRTTDSILNTFQEWVVEKKMIDAHNWINAAQYLNVLIGDEHDKLYILQQKVANLKKEHIEQDMSVAKARVYVEATDTYKDMQSQKAKHIWCPSVLKCYFLVFTVVPLLYFNVCYFHRY